MCNIEVTKLETKNYKSREQVDRLKQELAEWCVKLAKQAKEKQVAEYKQCRKPTHSEECGFRNFEQTTKGRSSG